MWGWSYGGYATMAALAFSPETFACGIAMYGLSDLEAFMDRSLRGSSIWRERVGDERTEEGRALLRRHSPINAADRMTRPLLVTHGGMDGVAPESQSRRMVEALTERGHPVTYLLYPEEPHDYRTPESWESFWAVGERFLSRHLGGRFEPYGDEMRRASFEVITGAGYVEGLGEVTGSGS